MTMTQAVTPVRPVDERESFNWLLNSTTMKTRSLMMTTIIASVPSDHSDRQSMRQGWSKGVPPVILHYVTLPQHLVQRVWSVASHSSESHEQHHAPGTRAMEQNALPSAMQRIPDRGVGVAPGRHSGKRDRPGADDSRSWSYSWSKPGAPPQRVSSLQQIPATTEAQDQVNSSE